MYTPSILRTPLITFFKAYKPYIFEPMDDLNDGMFYMQLIVSALTFSEDRTVNIRIRGHMNTYA